MSSTYLFATTIDSVDSGYSTDSLLETYVGKEFAVLILCVNLCLQNIQCLGLFYNKSKQKCLLNAAVFFHSNTTSFVLEPGWKHYRASGDIRCDVRKGFVHNRELNMCYSLNIAQEEWLEAGSVCFDANGHLGKVDDPSKQNHLLNSVNALPLDFSASSGPTFVSCFDIGGLDCLFTSSSASMTIDFCVPLCKDAGKGYAFLKTSLCFCCRQITDPSKSMTDGACENACMGGGVSPCGGAVAGALYSVTGQSAPAINFYIGLNKISSSWIWSHDNEVAGFTAFNDTSSGSCAVMSSTYDFRWSSYDCNSKAGFLCEIPLN